MNEPRPPLSSSPLPPRSSSAGFTLIELLLYVSIFTIMIGALIPFAWNVIGSSVKSATQQEVFTQARSVSERIKYEIRNASGITSVTATVLTLTTSNAATNPTVIDLSSGKIRIKQGSGAVTNLQSNNTTASALTFTNYTSGDNKTKHVGFAFTMQATFGSANYQYTESTSVQSGAEVRSN